MKKYFYSHLIQIDILDKDLSNLNLSKNEKKELLELAHKNVHHEVMDTILSQLSEEDKKRFLILFSQDKHEKIWKHLNEKTEKIEEKIKQAVDQIRMELAEDIKKLKS